MSRRGMPERFADIEEMTEPWMEFMIHAFFELITERPSGMVTMPIPWSKIELHANHYGFDKEIKPIFHRLMRIMDDHLVKTFSKKGSNGGTS